MYIHGYIRVSKYIRTIDVYTYLPTYIHTHIHTHTYISTYMDPKCTNNQAEAYAILKALEYLQNTQKKRRRQSSNSAFIQHDDTRVTNQRRHTHIPG